ncbi:MAG: CPBP family intramembrane glutamic endopeptidase [Thermodesulfobacteriota bacterium]
MGQRAKPKTYLAVLVVLATPFYLNDFANIYVKSWAWWLFMDYVGVKLFPLLTIHFLLRRTKLRASEFGLTPQRKPPFLGVFLALTLLGTAMDQNGYKMIEGLPGYTALGSMPAITDTVWNWIDLTLGLLAVAAVEELVFRGYAHAFMSRYTRSQAVIVAISSAAFGLIHWSLGLHSVLITAGIGAMFMLAYVITRSLPAIVLAHFAVNFIDYAGVIPKSMFKFL